MKQIQNVTVRTDSDEELQAMHALIQSWIANGWSVKNISRFSRSEGPQGGLSGLGMPQIIAYSTIIFEKDDPPFCPICNTSINDMSLHRSWHLRKDRERQTGALPEPTKA